MATLTSSREWQTFKDIVMAKCYDDIKETSILNIWSTIKTHFVLVGMKKAIEKAERMSERAK